MTLFILLFLAGLLTGIVIRPLLTRHKHDWEVIWFSNLDKIWLPITYYISVVEKASGFELPGKQLNVTYKKCKKCNECSIDISAAGRTVNFDYDVVKSKLDARIAEEKDKEDKALIDSVNARIGLTSPKVPYDPKHEHQQNPPQQVDHRGEDAEQPKVVGSGNPRNLQAPN